MPQPQRDPTAHPLGPEHPADHAGDGDRRGLEAAPRAGVARSRRGRTRRRCDEVLADLATALGGERAPAAGAAARPGMRLIVLITPDRGLAGAVQHEHDPRSLRSRDQRVDRRSDGDHRRPQGPRLRCAAPGAPLDGGLQRARRPTDLRRRAARSRGSSTDDFLAGRRRRASTSCTRASCRRSTQRPTLRQLLPIEPPERHRRAFPATSSSSSPSPAAVLERAAAALRRDAALPGDARVEGERAVERAWSRCSNATENADDLIDDLTLTYNKVRQANITSEMLEIASGAEAR